MSEGINVHPSHMPNVVDTLEDEVTRLKSALGLIAELGDRCEECDPSEAPLASHVTSEHGHAVYLCSECAADRRAANRKAVSKGCGPQPLVGEYDQDIAVRIALEALGLAAATLAEGNETK